MKRRLAIWILVLAFCSTPSFAAYALVNNTAKATVDTTNVTTDAIDTTGANLLILAVSDYAGGGAGCTPTDSKSNTWTARTAYTSAGDSRIKLWYSYGGTVGSGHTFTCSAAGTYMVLSAAAFSGSVASPYDVENGNTTGSGTTLATGSITPSENNELVISALTIQVGAGATIDNAFTETNDTAYAGGANMGGVLAYKIQTTAAAVNPTWSFASTAAAATIASFKESAPAVSANPSMMMMGAGR